LGWLKGSQADEQEGLRSSKLMPAREYRFGRLHIGLSVAPEPPKDDGAGASAPAPFLVAMSSDSLSFFLFG